MSEIISYSSRLKQDFQQIEIKTMELLDISTIKEFRNDPDSGVFVFTPTYYWEKPTNSKKYYKCNW